jgi:hypothetical protein
MSSLTNIKNLTALDFRKKVLGKGAHKGLAKVFPTTMGDVAAEVRALPQQGRDAILGLLLSENPIGELDFPDIKELLVTLLPNVRELDLSYTSLASATAEDMQVLTQLPQLRYVSIVGTVAAGPIGHKMRAGLSEEDLQKLIFMTPAMVLEGASKVLVPQNLVKIVRNTHVNLFRSRALYAKSLREKALAGPTAVKHTAKSQHDLDNFPSNPPALTDDEPDSPVNLAPYAVPGVRGPRATLAPA